ncbi:MAG: hypothetical protein JSW25_07125 [Thermoplasmata archaeon]|nr:MAG: hypothetical protein JSW25_07125 [Thermoplasmata archaeon]
MAMGMGPGVIVCRVQGHGPMHGHDDNTCGRHFFTKEERAEVLERYKEWLEKEAKGVEEAIERMKAE